MIKNNKGNFLLMSLILAAAAIGTAGYVYTSTNLTPTSNGGALQANSNVELDLGSDVLAETNQIDSRGTSANAPLIKKMGYAKKPDRGGYGIWDVYMTFEATSASSKAELKKILSQIRRDRYVVTTICPGGVRCNPNNDYNSRILSGYRVTVVNVCPEKSPIMSSTIIIKGVQWQDKLPSGSLQNAAFLTQSNWKYVYRKGEPAKNCKQTGGRSGTDLIINGVNVSQLQTELQ